MPFDTNILNDAPAQVDLKVPIGSEWRRRFQILDKRTGIARDLSTSTFKGQVRNAAGALIQSFTFIVNAGNVTFDVYIVTSDIAAIGVSPIYDFDWFRTVGGSAVKVVDGTFQVVSSVTAIP